MPTNSKTKGARVAAARAETEGYAREQPSFAPLRLQREESDGTMIRIARSLRKVCPIFGAVEGKATMVAGALMGYAFERKPVSEEQWCVLLAEVLNDNEETLDDDDNDEFIRKVIKDLQSQGVLKTPEAAIEVGDLVVALLDEDEEWHQAVVQEILAGSRFRVFFMEYGKPQEYLLLIYGQWTLSQPTKALKVNSAKGSVSCAIGRNCSLSIILFPRIRIPPI